MEFASELVALASIHQMRICEIPVTLYPMVGNADHICVHGEIGSDTWCCFTVFIY